MNPKPASTPEQNLQGRFLIWSEERENRRSSRVVLFATFRRKRRRKASWAAWEKWMRRRQWICKTTESRWRQLFTQRAHSDRGSRKAIEPFQSYPMSCSGEIGSTGFSVRMWYSRATACSLEPSISKYKSQRRIWDFSNNRFPAWWWTKSQKSCMFRSSK
jgi:hypothetical protein